MLLDLVTNIFHHVWLYNFSFFMNKKNQIIIYIEKKKKNSTSSCDRSKCIKLKSLLKSTIVHKNTQIKLFFLQTKNVKWNVSLGLFISIWLCHGFPETIIIFNFFNYYIVEIWLHRFCPLHCSYFSL